MNAVANAVPMVMNEGQLRAMQAIESGKSVFISGPGGVGKSFLIKKIRQEYSDDTVFLAPTGIAALNIEGATIHNTFRFPLHILTKFNQTHPDANASELFSTEGPVKRIVIDEISMVRADTFVCIDQNLRRIRRTNRPFGGLQVIAVGDFFQLPPVLTRNEQEIFFKEYSSPYCFATESWSAAEFEYVELTQIMRQTDETFISHLQNIRRKTKNYLESVEFFNQIARENRSRFEDEQPIFICSINATANQINEKAYEELDGPEVSHRAFKTGKFDVEPAPYVLGLKPYTKLICVKNLPDIGIMNGEIGYYFGEKNGFIHLVMESDDRDVYLKRNKWEQKEYVIDKKTDKIGVNVVGSFEQFPVRHAWALTVHKMQGTSIDMGFIDKGRGFFAHGQGYVALSRIRTLGGIGLAKDLNFKDIIVDPAVLEFYDNGCIGIGLGL